MIRQSSRHSFQKKHNAYTLGVYMYFKSLSESTLKGQEPTENIKDTLKYLSMKNQLADAQVNGIQFTTERPYYLINHEITHIIL